jgi:dihydroorotate dehydrogenase electron transfer subunit
MSEDPVALPAAGTVAEMAAQVVRSESIAAEYHHLVVAADPAATAAVPGQFFLLLCPAADGEGPFLRRPMSLYAADPAAGQVEFLFKLVGAGTRSLARLQPGETLAMLGPLGRGFELDRTWRQIVVVGRGAGLATLAPLAAAARAAGIGVTAILSARTPALVVSAARFAALGAELKVVTDSEGSSGPGAVERLLRALIAADRCDAFFTCGSTRLLGVLQKLARAFGLPGQVALEQQMACGLGMCHCCVRDFSVNGEVVQRRVCWEGPVFPLAEAVP